MRIGTRQQDERRREVSEAAWRVIVREGLDRASMRAIAQELGCTTGVVMHYFRGKQELMVFALHQVTRQLVQEMERQFQQRAGLERLMSMVAVFLPWNPVQQDIVRVWLAFLGYAVGRPELMAEHQQCAGELQDLMAQEVRLLQEMGYVRQDVDPDVEARGLLAWVNGLAIDAIIHGQPLDIEQQKTLLQRYLGSLS